MKKIKNTFDLNFLEEVLKKGNKKQLKVCLERLEGILITNVKEILLSLIELLNHQDYEIRADAAILIGKKFRTPFNERKFKKATDIALIPLLYTLVNDEHVQARIGATIGLGYLNDKRALPAMKYIYKTHNPDELIFPPWGPVCDILKCYLITWYEKISGKYIGD